MVENQGVCFPFDVENNLCHQQENTLLGLHERSQASACLNRLETQEKKKKRKLRKVKKSILF